MPHQKHSTCSINFCVPYKPPPPSFFSSLYLLQIKLSAVSYLFFFYIWCLSQCFLCYIRTGKLSNMLLIAFALRIKSKKKKKRERRYRKRTAKQRERWSHLRVELVALTLSAGLRRPSVRPGPAAEWRRTAVFCPHSIHIHTFSSRCWLGAIGSGQQMPNTLSVLLWGWGQRHATHQPLWQKLRGKDKKQQ